MFQASLRPLAAYYTYTLITSALTLTLTLMLALYSVGEYTFCAKKTPASVETSDFVTVTLFCLGYDNTLRTMR